MNSKLNVAAETEESRKSKKTWQQKHIKKSLLLFFGGGSNATAAVMMMMMIARRGGELIAVCVVLKCGRSELGCLLWQVPMCVCQISAALLYISKCDNEREFK